MEAAPQHWCCTSIARTAQPEHGTVDLYTMSSGYCRSYSSGWSGPR